MVPTTSESGSLSPMDNGHDDDIDGHQRPPSSHVRFRVAVDLALSTSDFYVLSDKGDHVFRIDGGLITAADTVCIKDLSGKELYRVSAHGARNLDRLGFVDSHGVEAATVVRQSVSPLRDSFSIVLTGGDSLKIVGDVPRHEYAILDSREQVAEVSRRWFRARGSYGIEMEPGETNALLVASIVTLDLMVRRAA